MSLDLTASIVLYQNDREKLLTTVNSFLTSSGQIALILVDNSPTDSLRNLTSDPRVEYIFNGGNKGFGAGHNVALRKFLSLSPYHLILNPDVYFDQNVIPTLLKFMSENHDVGQITPLIRYPDGRIQYSGKLLPTPIDLIARRLFSRVPYFKKQNDIYELCSSGYNKIMNVPNHLGCFMFIRTSSLLVTGLFDEKIFMYTEDVDLTRRIHRHAKTIFYPSVEIFHHYERGSQKKLKLLFYHIKSAIYYFNKWGWFSDQERKQFNSRARLTSGL